MCWSKRWFANQCLYPCILLLPKCNIRLSYNSLSDYTARARIRNWRHSATIMRRRRPLDTHSSSNQSTTAYSNSHQRLFDQFLLPTTVTSFNLDVTWLLNTIDTELPTMSLYKRPNFATNPMRQHLIGDTRIQTSVGHTTSNVYNVHARASLEPVPNCNTNTSSPNKVSTCWSWHVNKLNYGERLLRRHTSTMLDASIVLQSRNGRHYPD